MLWLPDHVLWMRCHVEILLTTLCYAIGSNGEQSVYHNWRTEVSTMLTTKVSFARTIDLRKAKFNTQRKSKKFERIGRIFHRSPAQLANRFHFRWSLLQVCPCVPAGYLPLASLETDSGKAWLNRRWEERGTTCQWENAFQLKPLTKVDWVATTRAKITW